MKKKFAVVLSGCGVYDGSEIGEAMMTLLAIEEAGCHYQIFAPDKLQMRVVDHKKGQAVEQERNVLVESARIARGNVKPLSSYVPEDFDALVFPGGFGAATNLSSFAVEGASMKVDAQVEKAVMDTYAAKKILAAMCIAPVIFGKLIPGALLTVGHDDATNEALRQMGARPKDVYSAEVVIDKENAIYTTPCYMLPEATLLTVAECCRKLVAEIVKA